jgi:hypothetical protein
MEPSLSFHEAVRQVILWVDRWANVDVFLLLTIILGDISSPNTDENVAI